MANRMRSEAARLIKRTPVRVRRALLAVVLLGLGLMVSNASASGAGNSPNAVIFTTTKNDGSFNTLADKGTQKAVEEFGLDVREWITAGVDETEQVLRQFSKIGIEHFLILGFENTAAVRQVASEFPDVKFTIIDGYIPDQANVRSILFAEEQSGFIAGVVAGLKTQTNIVGTIGGRDIPPVLRFMCGFAAGVAHVNPDARVEFGFVGKDFSAFRNIMGAHQAGQAMYSDGADIIFAPAGLAAEGVAKAAKEHSTHVIMVDANKNDLIPQTVLTSALKRVDVAAYTTWKALHEGAWAPGVVTLTVAENGVDWAVDRHNEALVADILDQVNGMKDELARGDIQMRPPPGFPSCNGVI